jgi:hypothetical protein
VAPETISSNFFPTTKMHRERTSYRLSAVPTVGLHPPSGLQRNSFKINPNNPNNVMRQSSPLISPAPLSYRQQAAESTAPFFNQLKSHHSFFEKK